MLNLAGIPVTVAIYLAGIVLVARVIRTPLYGIHFGTGPTLLSRTSGRTTWTLRLLPIAGHVQIEPPDDVKVDWEARPRQRWPVLPYVSRWSKALLYSSGGAALLAAGMAILGTSEALASFGRGFGQVLGGALDPLGRGSDNVRQLGRLLSDAPFLRCVAVLSVKSAAFNLLPLPPLGGAQVIQSLVAPQAGRVWLDWAANLGLLLLLLMIASYGLAVGLVLWFS